MPTYLVLLGPPGAGKGTQAQIVSEKLVLPHISSGDIFRENLKAQTELGKMAKGYMDRGELVPDDVTIAMIRERLSRPDAQNGALLDGFPRTPAQAQALDAILADFGGQVNGVPYIKVPEDVLVERLTGRWTCRAEGHVFHEKFNPPRKTGVCDFDGRIRVYLEQTMPLINYYQDQSKLLEIDGTQSIEKVGKDLMDALSAVI
jgi:adenylate kinase